MQLRQLRTASLCFTAYKHYRYVTIHPIIAPTPARTSHQLLDHAPAISNSSSCCELASTAVRVFLPPCSACLRLPLLYGNPTSGAVRNLAPCTLVPHPIPGPNRSTALSQSFLSKR